MKRLTSGLSPDVVRDVRRMLPVIVLLIVATIAVPKLIRGDAPEPVPATTSSAGLEDFDELNPAVLAEEPAQIRDFHRRLDKLDSKNPFHRPSLPSSEGGGGGGGANGGSEAATEATSAESAAATTTGGSVEEVPSSDEEAVPTSSEPEPVPVPADTSTSTEEPSSGGEEAKLFSTRIDVRVGPVGDTEVIRDVEELDFLPDARTPIAEYLHSKLDLLDAAFVVSPRAVAGDGDGKCSPSPKSCHFLLLEIGEEMLFEYEDGSTYRLELLDVNLHEELVGEDVAPEDSKRASGFEAGRSLATPTGT